MKYVIAFLVLFISSNAHAQLNKVIFNIDAGIGTGWWIQESDYKTPNETVTDWANSRLSLDAPVSASIQYNFFNKLHAGVGYTYHILMAKNLYASSPFSPSRTKTTIAQSSVNFHQYYVTVGIPAFKNQSLQLIPNVHAGTFSFNSLHPDDDAFKRNILLEANLKIVFPSNQKVHPFIEMYYSNLSFKSDVTIVDKRTHNVQSIGTKFGITF